MGFWESFKASYRAARDADLQTVREQAPDEPPFDAQWPPPDELPFDAQWLPPDEPRMEEAAADTRIRELEEALRECMLELRGTEASLQQRDGRIAEGQKLVSDLAGQLAEAKQLIVDLAAEIERLSKELKARPPREGNPGSGDAKFQKLRRFVLKKIHPDLAGGDKKLSATLQAICKDINAEIERIELA